MCRAVQYCSSTLTDVCRSTVIVGWNTSAVLQQRNGRIMSCGWRPHPSVFPVINTAFRLWEVWDNGYAVGVVIGTMAAVGVVIGTSRVVRVWHQVCDKVL